MIGDYLAQTVWWKAATPADAYGQAGHAAAVQTTGRWLEKRRLIRNAEGEQFGKAQLMDLLRRSRGYDSHATMKMIVDAVSYHTGEAPQYDDITAALITVT